MPVAWKKTCKKCGYTWSVGDALTIKDLQCPLCAKKEALKETFGKLFSDFKGLFKGKK